MRIYYSSLLAFLLIVLASVAFSLLDYSWQGWKPASCLTIGCFCEAQRAGIVRQPVNAYSNLAFVLVGLLILRAAWLESSAEPINPMRKSRFYPLVYATAVMLIGLGSLFFHASLTFVGQWFDVMGMYMQITFVLLYSLARWRGLSGRGFALAYLSFSILLGVGLVMVPQFRREIFAALVLAGLTCEFVYLFQRRPTIRKGYLWAALASFGIAYFIWYLDNSGIWCSPLSWLQGHALWHILSAIAAGLIYLYYRSEMTSG
jgi:hypothetical protein